MFDNLDPKQQAMLMMAAGLLSPQPRNMGRGAQFAGALSQGIQGGLLGYNQASQEKRRAEIMAQEAALRKMQVDQMQRQMAKQERADQVLANMPDYTRPQLANMAPTNENAAALAAAPKIEPHEVMFKRAEYFSNNGLPEMADRYFERATKMMPEVKEVRTVMNNGQPADLLIFKNGKQQLMPYGAATKLEKLDTGASVGFANPYTGQQQGPVYGKTASPDAVLSSNTTRRGQDMTDARARETLARPQWDSERGVFITPPTAGAPSVIPVAGLPDNGKNKPSEAELTAAGYANRMLNADKIIADIGASGHQSGPSYIAGALVGGKYGPAVGRAIEQMAMSQNQQKYRQAQEDWVRAKLRKESGAVIADDEMAREIATYFPQPWDKPETIAQKEQARQIANEQMALAAGKAQSKVQLHTSIDDLVKKYLKAN